MSGSGKWECAWEVVPQSIVVVYSSLTLATPPLTFSDHSAAFSTTSQLTRSMAAIATSSSPWCWFIYVVLISLFLAV